MNKTEAFSANETKTYSEAGDFFRIMICTFDVNVVFYYQGREVFKADTVNSGYWERFRTGIFDRFTINSPTAQTLQFASRLGSDVGFDKPPTGNVAVTNTAGAYTNGRATVNSTVVTTLLAANASRRFAEIQNNDGAVYMRFTTDGTNPNTAAGMRLGPGQSWTSPAGFAPTGAINAIMESGAGSPIEYQAG